MKISKTFLFCLLGCLLQGTASAQVYESTDAEGVTEFSDTPTTDSREVELQPTNTADPVQDSAPEMAPAQEQMPAGTDRGGVVRGGGEEGEPGYIYYGNDDDETGPREQRREDAARIENRLSGEGDVQVREAEAHGEAVEHPQGGEGAAHGPGGHR